ncbi:MAG: DUF1318 domain-containing protein [bacterium]
MKNTALPVLAALTLFLGACAGPTVNLATPEPIKVDIAMRLDVYQHPKEATKNTEAWHPLNSDPDESRRNRMADIQTLKNSRLVGEGHDALLAIRVDTPGGYGDFIRKTVDAENSDRMALMKVEAERGKTSLPKIQAKKASLAAKLAFKGEWIEISKDDGTQEWIQKEE